ncbi:acyl-CoA thioesterase/BAAT N-terminal domain-containing protein [bacterium AH-315-J04]|nr:acyl-CoA thioesterase/BAAT N-terminal domain-containing protein [bacterium AH-315-J04]
MQNCANACWSILFVVSAFVPSAGALQPNIELASQHEIVLGDPIQIRLVGLSAGSRPTLRARLIKSSGEVWKSSAQFLANESGSIDLSKDAPQKSSYAGVDSLGIFWSMDKSTEVANVTTRPTKQCQRIEFELFLDGKSVAQKSIVRWLVAPGVTRKEITSDGLVATLFLPESTTKNPGIIIVGGSEGGIDWARRMSGLLASHGYAAFALAYFGMEGLPQQLEEIPLEYLERAAQTFKEQSLVDGSSKLAVMGISKGAELALLMGVNFSDVNKVIAIVPSHVVWQSVYPPNWPRSSSWSREGKPLPFVPYGPMETIQRTGNLLELYHAGLKNKTAVANSTILVELTQGPILLISGKDDHMWPSSTMSDAVMSRLKKAKYAFHYEHLAYDEAGHAIAGPGYEPVTQYAVNNWVGGSRAGNARAAADSWQEILRFLASSFRK